MVLSISTVTPGLSSTVTFDISKPVTQQASAASREEASTVRLSQTAQIHALIQQGQGAAIIASTLGIPVSTVDSVLGIVVAAPVVVVAPSIDLTVNTKASGTPAPALIDIRI